MPYISNESIGYVPENQNTYTLLTSANLNSSATYTSSAINAAATTTSSIVYPVSVNVSVQHTAGIAPGNLFFEVGSETSDTPPSTWYIQHAIAIPSNSNWHTFTFPLTTKYYRLRFVNGATTQTNFRLATMSIYNGPQTGISTYPSRLLYDLSTSTLSGAGVFTGPTLDFGDTGRIYNSLTATSISNVASATNGFTIQVSRDASTWRTVTSATASANTFTVLTGSIIQRYVRVVYTNAASAQSSFELACAVS